MLKRLNRNFSIWLFVGDMLLTLAALGLARVLREVLPFGVQADPIFFDVHPALYGMVLLVWLIVFSVLPVYDRKRSLRATADMRITLTAIAFAVLILAGLAYFFYRELSRFLFVYFTLLDVVFLLAWRVVLRAVVRIRHTAYPDSRRRVLIVGDGHVATELALRVQSYGWTGLELVGFLSDAQPGEVERRTARPILGSLADAGRVVAEHRINEVLIALPMRAHRELVDLVLALQPQTVEVRVVPDLFDLAFARTQIEDLDGIPLVGLRDPVLMPFQRMTKRAFDLVVGSALLMIFALPMILVAGAIKLSSSGPAVFRQRRVGEYGRLFWMYKFRTMIDGAEARLDEVIGQRADGAWMHKRPDDPRITRVGRWLRRFSIDELPQLFNVLRGDMSLVGPRPELPWLVDRYADWQRKRFAVPQGMTGWWQINGRSDRPLHENIHEDLYYIRNYSLWLDILILWKTIGAVFRRTGAF